MIPNAQSDDQGAGLQPDDELPDDLAVWRGLVVGGCISLALWIVFFAAVWGFD